MPNLKFGMKPYRREALPLAFKSYLDKSNLPKLPTGAFGHVSAQNPPGGWGMLGNDRAGDCVVAGAGHEHIIWPWATKTGIPRFTAENILEEYSKMLQDQGNPPYDPSDDSTDTGLDPVLAAQYRHRVGLLDADGNIHKIGPFVAVDTLDQLEMCAFLFGCAACCWQIPESAGYQFSKGHIWDDTSGEPMNGHYTVHCGRNSAGVNFVSTWGGLQGFTKQYASKYFAGGIGYLSKDYMLATGKSPEGILWNDLLADANQVPSYRA